MLNSNNAFNSCLWARTTSQQILLSVRAQSKSYEEKCVDLGTKVLLKEFPQLLNSQVINITPKDVAQNVWPWLPQLSCGVSIMIIDEPILKFLQQANYDIQSNHIYSSKSFPALITIDDFVQGNNRLFADKMTADFWPLLRAKVAIFQAVCFKYRVENIVLAKSD